MIIAYTMMLYNGINLGQKMRLLSNTLNWIGRSWADLKHLVGMVMTLKKLEILGKTSLEGCIPICHPRHQTQTLLPCPIPLIPAPLTYFVPVWYLIPIKRGCCHHYVHCSFLQFCNIQLQRNFRTSFQNYLRRRSSKRKDMKCFQFSITALF